MCVQTRPDDERGCSELDPESRRTPREFEFVRCCKHWPSARCSLPASQDSNREHHGQTQRYRAGLQDTRG